MVVGADNDRAGPRRAQLIAATGLGAEAEERVDVGCVTRLGTDADARPPRLREVR